MTSISVIIPTSCELSRWQSLLRAMGSVEQQQGVQTTIILVVNGHRFDATCYEALKTMPGLRVLYRAEGSAPLAQHAGRLEVDTEFFAFLDDDDEYLPDTLRLRVHPLLDDPELDFTVANGYRRVDGQDRIVISAPQALREHALLALAKQNWMASCAGVFRTRTVTPEYFADPAPFLEWTYLAYRLCIARRMQFVDAPAYRIHDSMHSLSKSDAYFDAELEVLRRILGLPLPAGVARAVQQKLGRAYHFSAGRHVERGEMRRAWSDHIKSLRYRGGAAYLMYSRKLLAAHAGFGRD